jgi:hypothetical protein
MAFDQWLEGGRAGRDRTQNGSSFFISLWGRWKRRHHSKPGPRHRPTRPSNGAGLPRWPLYAENVDQFMDLGEDIKPRMVMPDKAKLEFFEFYFAKLLASAR